MNPKEIIAFPGLFITLLLLAFLPFVSIAQEESACDSLKAMEYRQMSDSLYKSKNLPAAIKWRKEELRIYSGCHPPLYDQLIETHFMLGRLHRKHASYDSARVFLQTGISLMEAVMPDHQQSVELFKELGILYYFLGDCNKAYKTYEYALHQSQKKVPIDSLSISSLKINMALCLEEEERFDEALVLYNEALTFRKAIFDDCHPRVAEVYINMGMIFHYRGEYKEALYFYHQARDIWEEHLEPDDNDLAIIYNNIGVCHQYRGDYQLARELLEKSRAITIINYGAEHPQVATATNNLGLNFIQLGDYNRAMIYFQYAQRIREEKLGMDHPSVGIVYNNKANCFRLKKDYKQAYIWHQKSLKLLLQYYGEEGHTDLADTYNDLGLLYEETYQYELALTQYRKALRISLNRLGENHTIVADAYARIGQIFLIKEQFDEAIWNFEKALTLRKALFGEHHPEVRQVYSQLASCYPDDTPKALQLCDQALVGLEDWYSHTMSALMAHTVKGRILLGAYRKSKEPGFLLQADTCMQNAQEWFDRSRFTIRESGSKQLLYDRFFNLFEMAMELYYELQKVDYNPIWIEKALQIQEKSRNVLLQEALQQTQAENFAGIPDSLLELERQLRLDITYYENQYGQNAEDEPRNQLFEVREQYYQLLDTLKLRHPTYFQLRFGFQAPNQTQLKAESLDEQTSLLMYFWGEQGLYLLLINADTSLIFKLDNPVRVAALVADLRSQILPFDPLLMASDQACEEYAQTAWLLYQMLLEPAAPYIQGQKLLIIPDGPLGSLPFEALISSIPEHLKGWKSLPYLIHEYPISYSYAASLLKGQTHSPNKAANTFLGVAPEFFERIDTLADMPLGISLLPLHTNQAEVKGIHAMLGGKALLGAAATRQQFLDEAPKYRILHLATHALANDSLGAYSLLAFSPGDSVEYLLVRDLYNLSLNADLVVLSACETSLGEWQRGEGVVSLARGFFYAGTRSLVTTLWTVDDEQTASIMLDFYHYLQQGMTKDEALRTAKTTYLKNNSALRNHPFYWAAHIPMGDTASMKLPKQISTHYWLLGFSALALTAFFWLRRRKRPA